MAQQSRPKHARDNRANQLNKQHPAYHRGRGASPSAAAEAAEAVTRAKAELAAGTTADSTAPGKSVKSK